MSTFERYLSVWVALCIVAGVALGHFFPAIFHAIGAAEVARVNIPVAVLIWLMIIPMLLKIDFAALHEVGRHWRGIGVTLFINWAVKPFSMALLGWLFIGWLFRPYLPGDQIDSYIAGLIILAAAPCTAMVFVWSNLTKGNRISPCRRSRSTMRSWSWHSPRSSGFCSASQPSPYRGIRLSSRSRFTSSYL